MSEREQREKFLRAHLAQLNEREQLSLMWLLRDGKEHNPADLAARLQRIISAVEQDMKIKEQEQQAKNAKP
jgi:hypothetical protein